MTTVEKEGSKYRPPVFSGKDEDWDDWFTMMMSDLEQLDYGDVVEAIEEGTPIPSDNSNPTANSLNGRLKKQNKKAFGRLMLAFDLKDELSRAAFKVVGSFKDRAGGYKHGNIVEALCRGAHPLRKGTHHTLPLSTPWKP